uniref:Uncharacterized protein n=1 Tax=Noctiluca scintillans TaxID=2966 RepID=A0A7S1AS31_NOCSC
MQPQLNPQRKRRTRPSTPLNNTTLAPTSQQDPQHRQTAQPSTARCLVQLAEAKSRPEPDTPKGNQANLASPMPRELSVLRCLNVGSSRVEEPNWSQVTLST